MHQRSSVVETRRLPAADTRTPDGFPLPIDFLEARAVETAVQPCLTLARVRPALAEVSTDLALAIYQERSRNGGNML